MDLVGPLKRRLHISCFLESGSIKLSLNNEVVMTGSGEYISETSIDVPPELTWRIEAKPGTNYRITVLEPITAEFSYVGLLDQTGIAFGRKALQIQS